MSGATPPDERVARSLANLGRALDRLEEATREPEDAPLVVDGTIQRFEFAAELLWKTLKRLLESEGVATGTPREAISAAWRAGWLGEAQDPWLAMLADRNRTSHVYDEALARLIFARVRDAHAPAMRAAHAGMLARRAAATDGP